MQQGLKNKLQGTACFLLYAFIFVLFTFPLVKNFGTQFFGIPFYGDSTSYIWSIWHFRYAVLNGSNPMATHMLFYPMGSSILMHSSVPIAGLLNVAINNAVFTMNLVLLLSFAFSGLGVFKLLRYFKVTMFLSVLGGFIYAYFPYKTAHLPEHFNLELTALIPFFILYILKAFRFEPGRFVPIIISKKYFFVLLSLSILSLLSDYYYSIYVFYFGLLFCTINKCYPYFKKFSAKKWMWFILILFVGGHFIMRGLNLLGADDKGALWWSADIASLFVPGTNSWVYSHFNLVQEYPQHFFRYPKSVEFVMFLGFGFFILITVFFVKLHTLKVDYQIRLMAIASLVFLLFCFPEFKVLGHRLFYNIFGLIYYIPFLNNVRTPPRYELMFMVLFLPVLMKHLSMFWNRAGYKRIMVAAGILLFIEYYPRSFEFQDSKEIPLVYQQLREKPEGAILPIPFGFRDGIRLEGDFNTNHFLYQTVHQKPIIGGYLSRLSEANFAQLDSNSTAQDLYQLMAHKKIQQAQLNSFHLPVKYIVIEPEKSYSFEQYIDTVAQQKIKRKTKVENYVLYELY